MDVVKLVEEGRGIYDWSSVTSKHNNYELEIKVFRDAMKFNDVPSLNFRRSVISSESIRDGVRLPASAEELQEIADLLNCMLLTPKVIDLIWLQADIKFDPVINVGGKIVAVCNIEWVHDAIEKKVEAAGGDDGRGLISCVGKYWCLVNNLSLMGKMHGAWVACNYGWCASRASGPGVTPGVMCWQRPGYRHGANHLDPSQTIRLMHRVGELKHPDGTFESVDIQELVQDPKLAPLVHHEGVLQYLRQKGVKKREPILDPSLDLDMWKLVSFNGF